METIRAFIAIPLSTEAQEVLAAAASQVVKEADAANGQIALRRDIKWVAPEKAHLTVRFLGDTAIEVLPQIYAGMDEVAGGVRPFSLHLDSLGCFPDRRRPRVIWVGVAGELAPAQGLRDSVNRMLRPLGWETERKAWQPHITIGRVRRNHRKVTLPWGWRVAPAPIKVNTIQLIESRLRPGGAVYTVRHRSWLQGAEGE